MDSGELLQIRDEIEAALKGRLMGRIYALTRESFIVDFHPHAGQYLLIEAASKRRRIHLVRRKLKTLEREAGNPSPFLLKVRDSLSNKALTAVAAGTSQIRLAFENGYSLVASVGRASRNVLLISPDNLIEAALFQDEKTLYRIGQSFELVEDTSRHSGVEPQGGEPLSDALDQHFLREERELEFGRLAAEAKRKIASEITKRKRLLQNLASDLERHGDTDKWKRLGDLLLANVSTARRQGETIIVTDYFSDDARDIEIEGDATKEIPEIAEDYFRKYTKARNAAVAVSERIEATNAELAELETRLANVESAIAEHNTEFLETIADGGRRQAEAKPSKKKEPELKGVRRFISSDGFEILVGKKATDNDHLSFRIAKSLDLWMHAADYPGSHVVVRNPNRKEIPQRTVLEAAELAAFYSSGRKQTKAAVNYTQKKHVNKPRRAAPGLVSLSSFRTILVQPQVRLKAE
jgi:predicted ribosome quality control (RQC) complex YloA/Tae2 family protein